MNWRYQSPFYLPQKQSNEVTLLLAPYVESGKEQFAVISFYEEGEERDGSADSEDWIAKYGAPSKGVQISLTITASESLQYNVALANSAAYDEVAGLAFFRQESFSSYGFRGTVNDLFEKAMDLVLKMRDAYPTSVPTPNRYLVSQVLTGYHQRDVRRNFAVLKIWLLKYIRPPEL
jgi:hypothetical protein